VVTVIRGLKRLERKLMNRLKAGMLGTMWLCIFFYSIANASANPDISHSRIGATTYSTISGSMVVGRQLAVASDIYTCNAKRVVLVWEFYDQVDNKDGEAIVEGTVINATFKSGETQINLPLTTVGLFKPEYAPFTLYTFVSEEVAKLKTLGDSDLSVSLDTSSHEGIDSSETFQIRRLGDLIDASKEYCVNESTLAMSIFQNGKEVTAINGTISLANEPFILEFEVDDDKDVDIHIERDSVFFNKFPKEGTLAPSGPFFWAKSGAWIPAELYVGGDSHNSLTGESRVSLRSNGNGTTRLRLKVDRIGKLRLSQPMPLGEKISFYFTYISKVINAGKNNIYGVPAGKTHIVIEEKRGLSEDECLIDGDKVTLTGTPSLEVFPGRPEYQSIEEGDEEWKYWILTTNKKYTCGYTLSYESGELYRKEGNYSRFQLANYKFPRKVLSDARNKNIRSDKGVITITGQIMFGHNAHHVTPVVLIDGSLVKEEVVNPIDGNISFEYASVDVDVLQETDGSQFLTIDNPSRTLTIHQIKEYEWFSTLFNNLQESQMTDHPTVKVGIYGGDMTNITSHASTYSKVIDGHKSVVIALDEQAFMMFNKMMKWHLTDLDLGYISVYVEHSDKFYNGDFLLPASINQKFEPHDSLLNQQGLPNAWVVQLGNFGNRSNAIRLKEKVVKAGFTAYMIPKDDLFKVVVGPELNRSKAKDLQQKLKNTFNVTGRVILYEVEQP
jgi:hypothetical protein